MQMVAELEVPGMTRIPSLSRSDYNYIKVIHLVFSSYIDKSSFIRTQLYLLSVLKFLDRATFPFAIPVNAKYQSVHGVTICIINPIQSAG